MERFDNVISLGFFCGVAEELMKYGKRINSLPFDWTISSFKGILDLVSNNFLDFFNEKYFYQNVTNRNWYLNSKYNIEFYHDFNSNNSLITQIAAVEKKYNRRITCFYEIIKKPSLFIRYVQNEEELEYIKNNKKYINSILCKNEKSKIIYIANKNLVNKNDCNFYYVEPDMNDSVCRIPLTKTNIYIYIDDVVNCNDDLAKYKYEKIVKKRKSILNKINNYYRKHIKKQYIHFKKYKKNSEGEYILYEGI